jgi:hypothetical protein
MGGVETEEGREELAHVFVAGVNLVHDQHLAGESQQTERLVAQGEDADQRLIDRADADVGEQRLLARVGEPAGAVDRGGNLPRLIGRVGRRRFDSGRSKKEIAPAVGEHEGGVLSVLEEPAVDRRDAGMHGVRGRHRGQPEVEAGGVSPRDQTVGEDEGGFGLAAAGDLLDHEEVGAVRQLDRLGERLEGRRR